MSGSNGIKKFARVNREDELYNEKSRGTIFHSIQPNSVASTATLTADQVMQDLVITGAGSGTITWPSSTAVLQNQSVNSLMQNYLLLNNAGWEITVVNSTAAAETLSFPANFVVSSSFSLTLPASSARVVRFLIQGTNIYVY